jgi:hypothetical protein
MTQRVLHNSPRKDPSTTSEKHHLPNTLAEAKDSRGDRHPSKGENKDWLPSNAIRSTTPLNHQHHLRE